MFLCLEKMNIKLDERMDDFGFLHVKVRTTFLIL
jgi:hypothetical protein